MLRIRVNSIDYIIYANNRRHIDLIWNTEYTRRLDKYDFYIQGYIIVSLFYYIKIKHIFV